MPADDRDTKFERALEQHLRAGSAQAGCPDAETLAAYHERSLSLEEMAHWKLHLAGCAACQEALSLVEVTEKQLAEAWEGQPIPLLAAGGGQTAPARATQAAPSEIAAPAAKPARKQPALMRWAVPIGAVAAGVLVWIGVYQVRELRRAQSESVQVAKNRQTVAPAPSTNYEVAPKAEPPSAKDLEQGVPAARARIVPAPAEEKSIDKRLAPPTMADALRKEEGAGKKQPAPDASTAISGNGQAPAPPPPAPALGPPKAQAPGVAAETVEVSPAVPPVETERKPVDLPVTGVAGGAAEDQKHIAAMNKAKSAAQPQAEWQSDTNAMMYSQGLNRAMIQASKLASRVILTPDHKVWWKIGAQGAVELTTDAGKNWRTLTTGATAQLTAGFAPSGKVCWIAGQGGTLVLTTDRGGHWKSLATPISGDLGGVHALDAKHATIWDANNRLSYETGDGGANWKQVANE